MKTAGYHEESLRVTAIISINIQFIKCFKIGILNGSNGVAYWLEHYMLSLNDYNSYLRCTVFTSKWKFIKYFDIWN